MSLRISTIKYHQSLTQKSTKQSFSGNLDCKTVKDTFQTFAPKKGAIMSFIHKSLEKTAEKIEAKIIAVNKKILVKKTFDPKTQQIKNIPTEVNIAMTQDADKITYYFLDPKTNEEIGYTTITDLQKSMKNKLFQMFFSDSPLIKNYPQIGINGERVSIDSVQNNNQKSFGGVAQVAENLAIEYCIKNNIKPNILSIAAYNSHAAHYKRGARFFNVTDGAIELKDYNKIIADRIKHHTGKGEIYTEDLGNLYMYLPAEILKKHIASVKNEPILSEKIS